MGNDGAPIADKRVPKGARKARTGAETTHYRQRAKPQNDLASRHSDSPSAHVPGGRNDEARARVSVTLCANTASVCSSALWPTRDRIHLSMVGKLV